MKFTKIFLALFAALFIVILPLGQAQATTIQNPIKTLEFNDGIKAKILVDNKNKKVVETEDENYIYVATHYKNSTEVEIKTFNKDRELISKEKISDGEVESEYYTDDIPEEVLQSQELSTSNLSINNANTFATTASYTLIRENVFSDAYGYWVYSYSGDLIWKLQLRTGVLKSTKETSTNSSDLANYKASVDSFISNKNQMVAKVGAGIIGTIVTLYLVPEPTWTKVLAGLLTVVSASIAYAEGKAMMSAYDDSRYYYARVKVVAG